MNKNNFAIIAYLLIFSVMLAGCTCLFLGVCSTYKLNIKTKNYLITDGYYRSYEVYNSLRDGNITYRLNYIYKIDGKEYNVSTKYGVDFKSIPKYNSKRKVKYSPKNYEESILMGINFSNILIYFGSFFILIGGVFILEILNEKGIFKSIKFDIIKLYIGVVMATIGIFIIILQENTTSSLIKSMGVFILIPIIFIINGIYLIIKSIFVY